MSNINNLVLLHFEENVTCVLRDAAGKCIKWAGENPGKAGIAAGLVAGLLGNMKKHGLSKGLKQTGHDIDDTNKVVNATKAAAKTANAFIKNK